MRESKTYEILIHFTDGSTKSLWQSDAEHTLEGMLELGAELGREEGAVHVSVSELKYDPHLDLYDVVREEGKKIEYCH